MITAKNFWLWFGGIWLFCGLPLFVTGLYIGAQSIHVNKQLAAEGRTVEGIVLTKAITYSSSNTRSRRGSRNPTYNVTFRFLTGGGLVTGKAEATAEAWDALVERGPIRVTYLPDAPQHYRVEGQTSGWMLPVLLTIIGGSFTLSGGFILFRSRNLLHTRKRLQRDGITTTATVSDVQGSHTRINGVNQCVVLYRYEDDRGKSHNGKEYFSPEEAGQWKQGDRVTIRYDRRRPQHSIWIGNP
jgi:hypothetical protein